MLGRAPNVKPLPKKTRPGMHADTKSQNNPMLPRVYFTRIGEHPFLDIKVQHTLSWTAAKQLLLGYYGQIVYIGKQHQSHAARTHTMPRAGRLYQHAAHRAAGSPWRSCLHVLLRQASDRFFTHFLAKFSGTALVPAHRPLIAPASVGDCG